VDTGAEKPVLRASQQRFLDGMLQGMPFSELCRALEMTKANGALIVKQLRALGLVSYEPTRRYKRVTIDPGKSGAVVWWDQAQEDALDPRRPGPQRWWVFATPIPRYERADIKPDTWAVVVTAPWGQFAFTVSDRERLSFRRIYDVMYAAYDGARGGVPEGWDGTVRTVTEMVADAMGIQAVLPVQFIRQEEEDDGGDDSEGAADDGPDGRGE
jgi:hypothetical protein